MITRLVAVVVGLGLVTIAPAGAHAGDLSGTVVVSKKVQKPPVRSRGFVDRTPNPIMPVRAYDPLPEIVVVLEGGPVGPSETEPDRTGVKWQLLGHRFDVPVLPIVIGTEVDLKNAGLDSPVLYSPQSEKLLRADTVNPGGVRTLTIDTAKKAFEVRAKNVSHIVGRVVGFEHRLFSRVDADGKFEIKNVPEGTWTVRVWHVNGFLPSVNPSVEVGRRDKKMDEIKLPPGLDPDGPGASAGAE